MCTSFHSNIHHDEIEYICDFTASNVEIKEQPFSWSRSTREKAEFTGCNLTLEMKSATSTSAAQEARGDKLCADAETKYEEECERKQKEVAHDLMRFFFLFLLIVDLKRVGYSGRQISKELFPI